MSSAGLQPRPGDGHFTHFNPASAVFGDWVPAGSQIPVGIDRNFNNTSEWIGYNSILHHGTRETMDSKW
jgi:hypothetical protein